MWLIDTENGMLSDTMEMDEHPKFAILSHRWRKGEVTFQDMHNGNARTKPGFNKLINMTKKARKQGLRYIWIDSCCINKESSAELSEAINSMYRWYEIASTCYVYLDDVEKQNADTQFEKSEWFRRSWTLQELIAPGSVKFYDKDWQEFGSKALLCEKISEITGIESAVLQHIKALNEFTIARRMSWAARRKTTRVEDTAYCLMGIFDVNMPLLYGEGKKAFLRLQQEILKDNDDYSIFAWSMVNDEPTGLLAEAPAQFTGSEKSGTGDSVDGYKNKAISITNRGIAPNLNLIPYSDNTYWAFLNHEMVINDEDWDIAASGIFLRRLHDDDQYLRVRVGGSSVRLMVHWGWDWIQHEHSHAIIHKEVHVPQKISRNMSTECSRITNYGFFIPHSLEKMEFALAALPNRCRTNSSCGVSVHIENGHYGMVTVVDVTVRQWQFSHIILGFDIDFQPVCILRGIGADASKSARCALHTDMDCFCYLQTADWPKICRGETISSDRYRKGHLGILGNRSSGIEVALAEGPDRQSQEIQTFKLKIDKRGADSNGFWQVWIHRIMMKRRNAFSRRVISTT